MSYPLKTKLRMFVVAAGFSVTVSGCSDIYFDRRETIVPNAGDAMASNRVTMMVDPWPPYSSNRNIAMNGEVLQHAVERYREGRVIPPVNATTSSTAYAKAQAAVANANQSVRSSTTPSSSQPSGWASSSQPPQPQAQVPSASQTQAQSQDNDSQFGETR